MGRFFGGRGGEPNPSDSAEFGDRPEPPRIPKRPEVPTSEDFLKGIEYYDEFYPELDYPGWVMEMVYDELGRDPYRHDPVGRALAGAYRSLGVDRNNFTDYVTIENGAQARWVEIPDRPERYIVEEYLPGFYPVAVLFTKGQSALPCPGSKRMKSPFKGPSMERLVEWMGDKAQQKSRLEA